MALAAKHELVLFADEIYEKILYEDAVHIHMATPHRRRRAVPDLQRPVQGLPGLRLPGRLDGHLRAEGARRRLPRGHQPAGQHAAVRQRPRPARHPDRPRRLPEHQRPDPARRPAAANSATGLRLLNAIPGVSTQPAARGACTCSRGWTPRSTPSATTRSSSWTCCGSRRSWSPTARAFNWSAPDHFRFVTLPSVEDIKEAVRRIDAFLATYRNRTDDDGAARVQGQLEEVTPTAAARAE